MEIDFKLDQYKGNRAGVQALLKSPEVQKMLRARAALVEARLRSVTQGAPILTENSPTPNRERVRLIVNKKNVAKARSNDIVAALDAASTRRG